MERDRIPDSLHYRYTEDELAVIDHQLHATHTSGYGIALANWRPDEPGYHMRLSEHIRALPPFSTTAPWEITEYFGPIDPGTVVRHEVQDYTSPAGRQVRYSQFDRPARLTMVWNDSPPVPAAVPALAGTGPIGYPYPIVGAPSEAANCTGCREGNLFWPALRYTASSDPAQIGLDPISVLTQFVGDPEVHLYRDGQELPQVGDPYFDTLLGYELPPEPGRYRLTHELANTATAWEFSSRAVTSQATPEPYQCHLDLLEDHQRAPRSDTPCRPEPLIFLRYDLGLDLSNQAAAPGAHRFAVTAHRQPSTQPMPDLAGMAVSVSYDGGGTRDDARVLPRGDGRYEVFVVHPPDRRRASDWVSLRVEAWDAAGNRVEQVIGDAFSLRERTWQDGDGSAFS